MNNIEIFKNKEFGSIRTVEVDREIWFVGKDIAECLGYADKDQALRKNVDEEDKLTRLIDGTTNDPRKKNVIIINESGLYSLIFNSKLESAKKFKRWVTSEVLPSIRKHGAYITDELLSNNELLQDRIEEIKSEKKFIEDRNKELLEENKTLKEMKYACEYISYESKNETSYLPNLAKQIIKDYIEKHKGEDKLIELTNEGYILNKKEFASYDFQDYCFNILMERKIKKTTIKNNEQPEQN